MMIPIKDAYKEIGRKLIQNSSADKVITEENVFQEGLAPNKPLIKDIMNQLLLPGSRIIGFENLVRLHDLALSGKSCLLLMQHFSNFDIPNLYELLERNGKKGEDISKSIVSIAGMKLNEESDLARSFTEAYTRVVIYASSSMQNITDPKKLMEEKIKRMKINRAALRVITRLKHNKRIILLFPSGTRYRPWDTATGKGLKEVYSYLKTFNYMVFVAINGNTLRVSREGDMEDDRVTQDLVMFSVSDVYNCKEFRTHSMKECKLMEDSKQHVVNDIMKRLEDLHNETEYERARLLRELGKKAI
ncbi:MAG: 1-acyl-sn-glycerol-3-phosphate acyltransferase [Spirochaetia bacterium]